jgi:hypothetical protein
MAEFILGRIKFVYRNNWETDTVYVVDDVITQGGKTYICITNHTSSALFATDYSTNPELSKWNLLADGQQWLGDWTAGEYYNVGDLVKYGGIVYQCNTSHTAATYVSPTWLGLENDQSKWDEFATSVDWKAAWTTSTRYKVYDLVTYGGIVYICKTKHISSATDELGLEADQSKWETFNQGITYLGEWTDAVRYRVNDVVKYGADLWICTAYHTADTSFDNSKFSILLNGFEFEDSWSDSEVYQIGDVVTYGGYSYISKTNHTNEVPSTSTANWAVYTTGFNFRSDWNVGTDYLVGDVVRLGGYTYVALVDNTGEEPPSAEWNLLNSGLRWTVNNETYTDVASTTLTGIGSGATFDVNRVGTAYTVVVNNDGSSYVAGNTIKILGTSVGGLTPANDIIITVDSASAGNITAISHTGNSVSWKDGIVYVLGDVVFFGPNSYICVQGHTASSGNRPDADSTADYWNILAAGAETATLTTPGDTLYYGANGPQRLPIGTDGQVLRVSDGYPVWATYGQIYNSVFVGPLGVDEPYPAAGFSIDKPWKTIRFACKQVEEGYQNPQSKEILQTNKQFLIKEVNNFIVYTYKASVTGTTSGVFLTANTANINVNMPFTFGSLTGALTLAGSAINTSTVYYIKTIVANTSFTVSATPGGPVINAAGTGTGVITFNYDSAKAERDAGYIVDGLVYDLTHGGTQKTTANTLSFYDASGTAYITDNTGYQITQFIGSHQYLKVVIANVLSNSAPALNYQTLNGVSVPAVQRINTDLTAEADANANIQSLLDILVDGLSEGNTSAVAAGINPNTTVNIKTGTYTEVLPIVVPSNTAVVGDELRSTVVQPKSANPMLVNDKKKTISALTRIKDIIPDLIANNNITETAGNTQTQVTTLPAGSVGSTGAAAVIMANGQTIVDIINTGYSAIPSFQFTAPTGYNTSFLAGYGDGKAQIVQNYSFIIADVTQYYANSVTYGPVWTATDTLGREKVRRNISFILDALQHDMTYGGNIQSLVAGSAYYSSFLLNIPADEKPALIDAYTFMKSLIDKIIQKTVITAQSGNTVTRVTTGDAGSAGASTFAQARIQDVIDWITTGETPATVEPSISWASASLQTSYAAIKAKRTEIALDATAWVQKFHQNVVLDLALTTRDAGLIVDAIAYDLVLGTNFNSLSAGRRYLSDASSAVALRTGRAKAPTLGAINFIKYKVKNIAAAGAVAQMQTTLDDAINSITGGKTPRISYPDPVLPSATYSTVAGVNLTALGNSATFNITRTAISLTASPSAGGTGYSVGQTIKILGSNIGGVTPANDIVLVVSAISGGAVSRVTVAQIKDAVIQLEDNRNFLLDEVIAYIDFTYPALEYDKVLTRRDSNYILDALHYDLTYGGDSASQLTGQAYYTFGTSQISSYVKTATLDAIDRLSTAAQLVATNSAVTPTTGNTTSQIFKNGAQVAGPAIAATTIDELVTKIYNYVDLGLDAGAPSITITAIATTDTFTSNAHGLFDGDFIEMRNASTNGLVLGTTYYVVGATTNTFKLAATYGAVAITTFTNGTGLSISVHKTSMPYLGWVDSTLVQVYSTLSSAKSDLQDDVIDFINENYANLDYDESQARSDSSKVIDAVAYDFMFDSNFRAVKAGQAYNRPQAAPLLGRLQSSTRESLKSLQTAIQNTVDTSATAALRVRRGMEIILAQLSFGVGETPEMTGTTEYNNDVLTIAGVEILRANIDYLTHEGTAWVDANFGGTVTSTSATGNVFNVLSHSFEVGDPIKFTFTPIATVATATTASTKKITLNTTAGVVVGMPVTFDGTLFGGVSGSPTVYYVESITGSDITISLTNGGAAGVITSDDTGIMAVTIGGVMGGINANTTYYVLSTPTIDSFTVTAVQNSSTVQVLSNSIGAMTTGYAYDPASCRRDMAEFLKALIYDVQYTGNYKSKRAAQLYLNAINGSELSDMWLVRNATGVRNMTLSGLIGPLSVENEYGTKRPEGGSYTSLDPGFGPYDRNAWVNSRSCYVQNCSLFGTGATALKIDGALHAGGNRSIVANDYTTFISDGIGCWCTGANSLTELVSVFAYYSYAGYIAELGGRIRATNGNSSYGTYGVIAEGVDTYETPIYARLNNQAEEAFITNVITDGAEEVLRIEFANAGSNYTNASYTVSGAGFNAAAIGDEFRDYGVFETRLIDLNNGFGFGGSGYLTAANAAQLSNVGYITIAASDGQLSTAYTGMRILVTAGTGAGQSAAILNYNNGSKVAKIFRESFTNLTVTGSTDAGDTLTVASTATLYANMPIYLGTAIGGLLANTLYFVRSGFTATEFTVSTTSGGTAEPVTATTTGQTVTLYAAGWDNVIPGKATVDALDLTSTYIIEPRITYSAPGYTATARTLSAVATWQAVTYGANTFLAIPTGSTATTYSENGITWAGAGNLPSSTTWVDAVYGGGEQATATAVVGGLGGISAILEAVLGEGVSSGQVVAVNVIRGGFGYLTPPTIKFVSATGSLAEARAIVLDGAITGVIVDIPGSGYATTPTVQVRTDIITSFTVNSWGKNYTSPPTITVSGGGSTNQATGVAELTNNGVSAIAVGNDGGSGYTSTPTVTIVDSNAKFVAIPTTATGGTTKAAYTTASGVRSSSAWSASTGSLPNGTYASIAFGAGYWLAIGGTNTAARSADGNTAWTAVTVPTLGAGTYSSVTYGNGYFVAVASGSNSSIISSTSGNSWIAGGNLPASASWISVAYGNGRFVAIAASSTNAAYSIDQGETWIASPAGLPASIAWTKVTYGQGLFFAVASGSSVCATSPDGQTWTVRAMSASSNWKGIAFGNPTVAGVKVPVFSAVSLTSGQIASSIRTGATPIGRMKVGSGIVSEIRMIEPGSGYPAGPVSATTTSTNVITTSDTTNLTVGQPVEFTGCSAAGLVENVTYFVTSGSIVTNTSFKVSSTLVLANAGTALNISTATLSGTYTAGPTVTQIDPNRIRTAPTRVRVGVGVLGQPSFSDRGNANTTATASASGDGYSDLYQASSFINVSGLYSRPSPGANVEFASIPGEYFKLVSVTNVLGDVGNFTATFQINPALSVLNAPSHNDEVTTRLKYSQVRLTGHDFLYIGTGGFAATNYPNVNISNAITANQSLSSNGGRCFFTSTDQDGNFNVGNLFGVQQSTGTATLNASAFNLSGLQSLQLGTVSVGAGSAVITSFSTDPFFTANSDNIIPTQKAIKSYITAQIGGGQSSLNVNTLTSGVIYVANNTISTTTGVQINVKAKMNFTGGIDGAPVALAFFMQK